MGGREIPAGSFGTSTGAPLTSGRSWPTAGAAAGISATFNAPIAGALFALEVVLRHFAVHAFAPIAIASVAGTVLGRLVWGDVTEFTLPDKNALAFYVELPAFLLLGLLGGLQYQNTPITDQAEVKLS